MRKRLLRKLLWLLTLLFLLMNAIALLHAYKFTHYSEDTSGRIIISQLSAMDKLKMLFGGVNNPRPEYQLYPDHPYQVVRLKSNKLLEGWLMKCSPSKGTVILFHGYATNKSSMVDKAEEFLKMGYSAFLVDFMGSGGSEGDQTTIGYKEAEEVRTCFDFIKTQKEKNIILFGTSMGAAAIMRAEKEQWVDPSAIILECPFATIYEAVCNRFNSLHVPSFPMAGLLTFWGGVENGFWAFGHNPVDYAQSITCPVLLMYGEEDKQVKRSEIDAIYNNLKGEKDLVTFRYAHHDDYMVAYRDEWIMSVDSFLEQHEQ